MAQSSEKRRTSIGVLFWIAFILLVLVIFLANRSNIEQVLESTGLVEVMRDRFAGDETTNDTTPDAQADPADGPESDPTPAPRSDATDTTGEQSPSPQDAPGADKTEPRVVVEPEGEPAPGDSAPDSQTPAEETAPPPAAGDRQDTPAVTEGPAQRAPSPNPEKPNRLMAGLYFIRVTEDGRTFPQRVVRPVYYASSPLTETVQTLISGPTGEELNEGLLNLIPDGTRLISAHVQNGVAYLNFNQAFRFNPLGAEGTVAQLLQIIYSSTEFPTVERVQFLVEGERIDYLGGDGIFVGEPLGRDAFSS